jgi:uncharacterized membrane protein HdeD (DUF308 family)
VSKSEGDSKNQLFSEDEVKNPGYPGALLILGVPLVLIGSVIVTRAVLNGDLVSGALGFLLALVPGAAVIVKSARARHVQARPPWACPRCGYDRRGLDDSTACPECGTVPTSTS